MAIAKNPKVIMTERQFIERLLNIKNRRTYYKNKYPDNLCYIHQDGRTSADCVNLVKAILNGYNFYNNTIGYYQRDLSNTGDCTEAELLAQCSEVSSNFKELGDHCAILYLKGHIGTYLGKVIEDKYNVVECTASKIIGNGVSYSWVDADGTRRKEKNGSKNGKWTHFGRPTPWVEMEASKPIADGTSDKIVSEKVYYAKSGDTLTKIAEANGMTLAKLVSYNPQIRDINKISVRQKIYLSSNVTEEYYTVQKGDYLGTIARKFNMSLNKLLGLNPDIKNPNLIHVGDKIRVK